MSSIGVTWLKVVEDRLLEDPVGVRSRRMPVYYGLNAGGTRHRTAPVISTGARPCPWRTGGYWPSHHERAVVDRVLGIGDADRIHQGGDGDEGGAPSPS